MVRQDVVVLVDTYNVSFSDAIAIRYLITLPIVAKARASCSSLDTFSALRGYLERIIMAVPLIIDRSLRLGALRTEIRVRVIQSIGVSQQRIKLVLCRFCVFICIISTEVLISFRDVEWKNLAAIISFIISV